MGLTPLVQSQITDSVVSRAQCPVQQQTDAVALPAIMRTCSAQQRLIRPPLRDQHTPDHFAARHGQAKTMTTLLFLPMLGN